MSNEEEKTVESTEQAPQKTETKKKESDSVKIEVILSEDKLKCWINIGRSSEGVLPGKDEALQVLEEKKIVKDFINCEELERIFHELLFDKEVLIAEGKPKKDGKDGSVKYYFKTKMNELLKEDEKGKVDFKEISFIQQVKTEDVVAELIPPVKGSDGVTVTGETIEAKDGASVELPAGDNTEISQNNPSQLVSKIDGVISLKRNKVHVDPLVVIESDVDYSTGNINFSGAIIIKGGIKSGFSVKSESDVSINDVVEDAVIETEGSVVLKGGFIGRGTGRIKAGGEVILPFAENQSIYAGKDVIVTEALLHCTVESDAKVIVGGKKGIIGGSITALESIEMQSVGSPTYTKTLLNVGMNRETREKMEKYATNEKKHKANMQKINKAIHVLDKIKLLKRELPKDRKKLYDNLLMVKKKLIEEKKELAQLKAELEVAYKRVENAEIRISQRIFPGVIIEMGKLRKVVQEHGLKLVFRVKNEAITAFKPAG